MPTIAESLAPKWKSIKGPTPLANNSPSVAVNASNLVIHGWQHTHPQGVLSMTLWYGFAE